MIMIDPKMLELSIYDDIPHLLAPVVTEPAKAIRALKWAVEQMEDRYRMMSSVGVRNLQGFNDKILAAKAKGQPLGHKVQVGYDPMTGLPQYEEQQHDYQPLPQIVVIVDELADLMMTAGKEVEFLIQRLAQKARAAGISRVARVANYDLLRATFTFQDPKQFLFFTRTPYGIQAGKAFLKRLQERSENRDKEITLRAYFAQLKALKAWGSKHPADLSVIKQPVLVVNGDNDRMVPTSNTYDLAKRLPNSQLIVYPDAGHGGVFQNHEDFVAKSLAFLDQ